MFRSKLAPILGLILFLIPFAFFLWWIYVVNVEPTHQERQELYFSVFPEFMTGRFFTSYLALFLSAVAVILGMMGHKAKGGFGVLAKFVMLVGSFTFCVNLWSLM